MRQISISCIATFLAHLVAFGTLAVAPAQTKAGDGPQSLSSQMTAAGCSPSTSPIDVRLTSTDNDVAVISKVVASTAARFATSSSGSEPCEQLLVNWVNTNAKSDSLIQAIPSLVAYLEFNPAPLQYPARYQSKAPPFLAGSSGSTRRALIAAIEDSLIQHSSPTSEAALLLFSELNDPALANEAKDTAYGTLQRFPWLIDDELASNIVSGLHYFEQNPAKKAYLANARAIVSRFSFKRPYKSSLGFPWLFRLSALTGDLQSPPVGDDVDQPTWDAVYAVANAILGTTGQSDKGADLLRTRSADINYFRATSVGPAPNYLDLASIAEISENLVTALVSDLNDSSPPDVLLRRQNTRRLLGARELERRALVLFALFTASKSGIPNLNQATFVNADAMLDGLSADPDSGSRIRTVVAATIDKQLYMRENEDFDRNGASCSFDKLTLLERTVSFASGLFVETFRASCKDGRQFTYSIPSRVPTGYAVAWQRHPRLFDFLGISLFLESVDQDSWRTNIPDLDLIRGVPERSIPILLAALQNPNLPWQYLRDYMLLRYQPDFAWITRNDPPPGMKELNQILSGFNLAPNDALYSSTRDWLVGRTVAYINVFAKRRISDALAPMVNRLPDEVRVCTPVSGPNGSGFSCGDQVNAFKHLAISSLNATIAEVDALNRDLATKYFYGLDLPKCQAGPKPDSTRVGILINPDFTKYLVRYTWRDTQSGTDCDFGFERQLSLPADSLPTLRNALQEDAEVLSRFNIDIEPSSSDHGVRTIKAISNAANMKVNYASALHLFHVMGIYPLYNNFRRFHANDTGYGYTSYLDDTITAAVQWPVLREMLSSTEDGLLYDAELALFDFAFQQFQPEDLRFDENADGPPLQQPTQLNPTLATSIIGAYNQLVSHAQETADQVIAAATATIRKTEERSWSIGFTIGTGGFGPYGVLDFSINGTGAGIGFAMPEIAITSIVPDWQGIRVPINLNPRTSASFTSSLAGNLIPLTGGSLFSDIPVTSVAIPWTAAPPVIWTPSELDNSKPANKALFVGLLLRAAPALTDAEFTDVAQALKLPKFPEDLAKKLFAKSYEGVEMVKITAGEWYPTSIDLHLLPVRLPGQPCPMMGCIDSNDDAQVDAYVNDFNAAEKKRFDDEVAAAKSGNDERPFPSDVPAVSVTYGPGFKVMLLQFTWPTKKLGVMVTEKLLVRTPIFILDRVRANPTGHEFEKWIAAIVEGFATPTEVSEPELDAAKGSFVEDFGDRLKQTQGLTTDPLFEEFHKELEDAWKEFWSRWQMHGERELEGTNHNGFIEPFVPPPTMIPALKFFEPPWQHAWERGSTMEDWLIYERSTEFYKRVHQGGIAVAP